MKNIRRRKVQGYSGNSLLSAPSYFHFCCTVFVQTHFANVVNRLEQFVPQVKRTENSKHMTCMLMTTAANLSGPDNSKYAYRHIHQSPLPLPLPISLLHKQTNNAHQPTKICHPPLPLPLPSKLRVAYLHTNFAIIALRSTQGTTYFVVPPRTLALFRLMNKKRTTQRRHQNKTHGIKSPRAPVPSSV